MVTFHGRKRGRLMIQSDQARSNRKVKRKAENGGYLKKKMKMFTYVTLLHLQKAVRSFKIVDIFCLLESDFFICIFYEFSLQSCLKLLVFSGYLSESSYVSLLLIFLLLCSLVAFQMLFDTTFPLLTVSPLFFVYT